MDQLTAAFPQYALYITGAVTVASVIATMLPPPVAGGNQAYAVAYRIVNTVALAFGHATNASDPKVAGLAGTPAVAAVPPSKV